MLWASEDWLDFNGMNRAEVVGQAFLHLIQGPETDEESEREVQEAIRLRGTASVKLISYTQRGICYRHDANIQALRNRARLFALSYPTLPRPSSQEPSQNPVPTCRAACDAITFAAENEPVVYRVTSSDLQVLSDPDSDPDGSRALENNTVLDQEMSLSADEEPPAAAMDHH